MEGAQKPTGVNALETGIHIFSQLNFCLLVSDVLQAGR